MRSKQAAMRISKVKLDEKNLAELSKLLAASNDSIKEALLNLERLGYVERNHNGEVAVTLDAPRRTTTDLERRLVCYLLGYVLTEQTRVVRVEGLLGGIPVIAGTRIPVETIATYINVGKGIDEIQRDLPQLTRDEIFDALHYYLDHKENMDKSMRKSEQEYLSHKPATI